jgi:hypothetical protein
MKKRKGGRKPMSPERRRVRIAPTVAPESIDILAEIMVTTNESQGQLFDRLLALELKRLRRRQG